MAALLKWTMSLFVLIGIPITLYGGWQICTSVSITRNSTGRATARFIGYHNEFHRSSSFQRSPASGMTELQEGWAVASYPEFVYTDAQGQEHQVRESKVHVYQRYRPGDMVPIVLSRHGKPLIDSFFSLYARDLVILALGLGFILIPLLIWKVAVPSLATPAGVELQAVADRIWDQVSAMKVGPLTVSMILKGFIGFMALIITISLVSGLVPYWRQLGFGAQNRLITALKDNRLDEARDMIARGKGIHGVNQYDQSPLLAALEAGQWDIAGLLVAAGVNVNIKSKMYKTPLLVSVQAGNLEMVKLLVAHGAALGAPEDEIPPVFYAISRQFDEIARVLIEAGTDLQRAYISGSGRVTVGDMTILARKPDLEALIRQRNGRFSR